MTACGLDFGTSNSAIGVVHAGEPVLARIEGDRTLLPSALFFDSDSERRILYGDTAIKAYVGGEHGRLMRALKSTLGSPLIDQPTSLGRRRILVREIIAFFIRELKKRAEAFLGAEIDTVVHGRPVHFVEGDAAADARAQGALEDIARLAGFKTVVFEYEPIAAAMHYEETVSHEELILVADIGGGTSDFAVIRIGPDRRNDPDRRSDILASGGVRIGGTDFDSALSLEAAMPLLGYGSRTIKKSLTMPRAIYHDLADWATINFLYTYRTERDVRELLADAHEPEKLARLLKTIHKRLGHRIALAVEEAKLFLSEAEQAHITLHFLEDHLAGAVTRQTFETAIGDRTSRLTRLAAECIKSAGLRPGNIDTLFFTGGSSLVPAVRTAILNATPVARPATRSDFLSVAHGLTRLAQRRFG